MPLAIIPARGGSKRIPNKNIKPLNGKPLIVWTIETALRCPNIDQVVVTTDSEEIAEVVESYEAVKVLMRAKSLATDTTPDYPVFEHAVKLFPADVVVWLRPTSPLRTIGDVVMAMSLLGRSDSVRSVCPVTEHPYWMYGMRGERLSPFVKDGPKYFRKQSLPPLYRLNGAVEVVNVKLALQRKELYGNAIKGYVMPYERSVDIDTPKDFELAEKLMEESL